MVILYDETDLSFTKLIMSRRLLRLITELICLTTYKKSAY